MGVVGLGGCRGGGKTGPALGSGESGSWGEDSRVGVSRGVGGGETLSEGDSILDEGIVSG